MRIVFDIPDTPNHDVFYPFEVPNAIGYCALFVQLIDGKPTMIYSVGRASADNRDDAMMVSLEQAAREFSERFNKEQQ